jgi:hypothetical protein
LINATARHGGGVLVSAPWTLALAGQLTLGCASVLGMGEPIEGGAGGSGGAMGGAGGSAGGGAGGLGGGGTGGVSTGGGATGGSAGGGGAQPCSTGAECGLGFCVDGVCCDSLCDGVCESCKGASTGGTDGVCAAVTTDTDPDDDCVGAELCGVGGCACGDGVHDGDETGTDCGGSCAPCAIDDPCSIDADCESGFCVGGSCGYAASCLELLAAGSVTSGTYTTAPDGMTANAIQVYCEMLEDGGGWTRVFESFGNFDGTAQYFAGTLPAVAGSSEMMFAFVDTSTLVLSSAWKFQTPDAFKMKSPMEFPLQMGNCNYELIVATRLSDNVSTMQKLRFGAGDIAGTQCDQGCTAGSFGQICLKSDLTEGAAGGFGDFPSFAFYESQGADYCNTSDIVEVVPCSPSRQFVIFVR